ncbi:hypothetical protein, partial [Wolbachia endosymbiont of Atemnus politus]|uniref:hypothetical protein n=1 Tax=Wolbachia endosymbiont of Atemnus politus TaxID=2682840 RepID=UPI001573087D
IKQVNIGLDQVEVTFRIRELAQDEGIFNLRHCNERVDVHNNDTENNIIEFGRIIPRELLIYKRPNRVNAV